MAPVQTCGSVLQDEMLRSVSASPTLGNLAIRTWTLVWKLVAEVGKRHLLSDPRMRLRVRGEPEQRQSFGPPFDKAGRVSGVDMVSTSQDC